MSSTLTMMTMVHRLDCTKGAWDDIVPSAGTNLCGPNSGRDLPALGHSERLSCQSEASVESKVSYDYTLLQQVPRVFQEAWYLVSPVQVLWKTVGSPVSCEMLHDA